MILKTKMESEHLLSISSIFNLSINVPLLFFNFFLGILVLERNINVCTFYVTIFVFYIKKMNELIKNTLLCITLSFKVSQLLFKIMC